MITADSFLCRGGAWISEGRTADVSDVIALSAREHDAVDFGAWAPVIESLRESVDMVVE